MRFSAPLLLIATSSSLLPQASAFPVGDVFGAAHQAEKALADQVHPSSLTSPSSHSLGATKDATLNAEQLALPTRRERARMYSTAAHRRWLEGLRDKPVTREDGTSTTRHDLMLEDKRIKARERRRQKREGTWVRKPPGRPRLPAPDEATATRRLKIRQSNHKYFNAMAEEHKAANELREAMGIPVPATSSSLSRSSAAVPSDRPQGRTSPSLTESEIARDTVATKLAAAWEAMMGHTETRPSPHRTVPLPSHSQTPHPSPPVLDLNASPEP